ncbi:MAG: ABC transporter ATP-binding protein [Oscillospiraceae bacterium]|nr:ABC transporter ATP-binding protein [Oscillospiraceae bacterium]
MIKFENISKTYKTKTSVIQALTDVSAVIDAGEIYGVIGLNGAGKSTMIKILTGILKQDKGKVFINGLEPSAKEKYRRQYCVTYQNFGLDMHLSVRSNLELHGMLFGLGKFELKKRVNDVLSRFDLEQYENSRTNELSGGYRKRVQIARNFMLDVPVLIFDEPTVGLDPIIKNSFLSDIKSYAKKGCTIVITTQVLEEAEKLCDKIAVLHKGKILDVNTPQIFKSKYSKQNQAILYTGQIDDALILEVQKRLDKETDSFTSDKFCITITSTNDTAYLLELVNKISSSIKIRINSVEIKNSSLEDVFVSIAKED